MFGIRCHCCLRRFVRSTSTLEFCTWPPANTGVCLISITLELGNWWRTHEQYDPPDHDASTEITQVRRQVHGSAQAA
jgi:hypothetical protein